MSLFSGRRIAASSAWNLLGIAAPMAVALWAVPLLIRGLGVERFGLMSIVWLMVGYFSLFDLGIGRAITKLVAERVGTEQQGVIGVLTASGMRLMWLLGLVAAIIVAAVTPWLAAKAISMPVELRDEARTSLWILAATMPFVIASAGNVGILQGFHLFKAVTWVRLPLGILNYLGPVVALRYSNSLVIVTGIVAATRVLAWLAFHVLSTRRLAQFERNSSEPAMAPTGTWRALLGFGGWVTVSNIVGPVMVYFDRFLIGGVAGAAAVAYYTTPFDVITRMLVVPGAIMSVLFPAFAAGRLHDEGAAARAYARVAKLLTLAITPAIALIIALAQQLLGLWIGVDFQQKSAGVAQWLAVGVFANALGTLPFTALQGYGRPDITAKVHVAELFIYVPFLIWALKVHGIEGAAFAWAMRATVDLVILAWMCQKCIPDLAPQRGMWVFPSAVLIVFYAMIVLPLDLWWRCLLAIMLASVTAIMLASNARLLLRSDGANKEGAVGG